MLTNCIDSSSLKTYCFIYHFKAPKQDRTSEGQALSEARKHLKEETQLRLVNFIYILIVQKVAECTSLLRGLKQVKTQARNSSVLIRFCASYKLSHIPCNAISVHFLNILNCI